MIQAMRTPVRPEVETDPAGEGGFHTRFFNALLGRHLIFNTCWEDPRLDRVALDLSASDRVLVITSAGCNVLDYLLAGAGEIHAVDVNPCQNSLLELKLAAIRTLPYDAFFRLFGLGRARDAQAMYFDALRAELSPAARRYWDRRIEFFDGRSWQQSFYYRGTSGFAAKVLAAAVRRFQNLRAPVEALLAARTVDEQREIYVGRLRDRIWKPWMRWLLSQPSVLSLVGIPKGQHEEMLARYPGGAADYIRDCFETVVTRLPFQDNYFWRVYFQGHYTPDCCPEYLRPANFEKLKAESWRIRIATSTVTEHLRGTEAGFTRFVLLDHMDWMRRYPAMLAEEWSAILDRARAGARAIFRSAGRSVAYLDPVDVDYRGRRERLGDLLRRRDELADELHARDRVHTYGSFHIVDLPA